MTRLFLECAIRAALIVIGTAIVLYAMRVKVAAVKHRVWTAVLLLMLALPAWTAWGPKAELRLLPASVQRFAGEPIAATAAPSASATQPIASTAPITESRQRLFSTGEEILLGIYLLGVLTLFVRLMIGTVRARKLVDGSLPCAELPLSCARGDEAEADPSPRATASGIRDDKFSWAGVRSNGSCVAPVTVGCLRPTVILPQHWREWTRRQLDVVLAHEGEHVRRRDPLVQWVALLNRAIFWFHPAAWWLERELSALAEEACDAAVIAQGHDPGDYAETLMKIARDVMDSGSRINSVAVAMPGRRLPARIRTIIEDAPMARVSRVRGACVAGLCALVCGGFLAVTLVRAQDAADAATDWEKAAGGKMAFDVASVKRNVGSSHMSDSNVPLFSDKYPPNGGLFSATNQALSVYIEFAYKLSNAQFQVMNSEMPKWAADARFDIQARGPADATKDQMRLMMQSLLADRFALEAHFETRNMPVYLLELVKPGVTGPKLRPHTDDPPCDATAPINTSSGSLVTTPDGFLMRCGSPVEFFTLSGATFSGRNVSIQMITESFFAADRNIDRPVIDRTGLTGNYDFAVSYWPLSSSTSAPPDDAPPVLSDAIKHDLGLKLEATTAPFNKLIVDHIEEPTAN